MKTIGIEIEKAGKIYYFVCEDNVEFKVGDFCIVGTTRGEEVAQIVKICDESEISDEEKNQKEMIFRKKASDKDVEKYQRLIEKANNCKRKIKNIAKAEGLQIKILSVQFTFDETKMLINFSSEQRVDFRSFVKKLANEFRLKIELRQVGGRDETKIMGGIGPCGKVCCCNCHLREFDKVAIKMAKNQNISLNPNKINGLCGKLMCCLAYENETYEVLGKKMPRVGSTISTEFGKGIVMYNDILKQISTIKLLENDEYKTIPISELKVGENIDKN